MKTKLKMKMLLAIAFVLMVIVLWLVEDDFHSESETGLIINEVIADNHSLYHDSDAKYHDLIEIHNSGDEDINLKDYGLSDDSERPHKWQFPETIIRAGEYLLVSASGNQETDGLYTSFKLDRAGEKVLLSDDKGKIISSVVYSEARPDMSYGFDGTEYVFFLKGSPGLENTGISVSDIEWYLDLEGLEPEVSVRGGIYDKPQTIEFKQLADYQIRYTLDCSSPDPGSLLYGGRIDIGYTDNLPMKVSQIPTSYLWNPEVKRNMVNNGQVIRAQYFYGDIPVGRVNTNTYFIWKEGIQRYSFDVVSLSADEDYLFSGNDGIMVIGDENLAMDHEEINNLTPANYNFRGRAWEREGHLEIFDDSGELTLSQDIGIRVAGEASRMMCKKSLRIIARPEYGDNELTMDLFDLAYDDVETDTSVKSLVIRTGGQDWNEVIFRDVLTGKIMGPSLSASAYKPVILFINGEYFGIYNLREDMNGEFVKNHFNLKKDEFSMIEDMYNETRSLDGNEAELQRYKEFFRFMREADLSDDKNYDYAESMMDIDNYIDYLLVNIFIRNTDFYNNNIMVWRYTEKAQDGIRDGRYRYIIHDTDMGYDYYEQDHYAFDSFEHLETRSSYFFKNLMTNRKFKTRFISRLTESLNGNLSRNNVREKIDYLYDLYSDEIEENTIRWQITSYDKSIVIDKWYEEKVAFVRNFIARRQDYLLETLENRYDLEKHVETTVKNQSDNPILVNDQYEITGRADFVYYPEFQECILKLEFQETDDIKFANWYFHGMERSEINKLFISGDLFSNVIEIRTDKPIMIEAVFIDDEQ